MSPVATYTIDTDVIVIGAGFGGCCVLHHLREKGFEVKVLEAANCLGGVWAWNRYPGARVDCEVPYYGFSDPAIWSTWIWDERFPSDTRLREYFRHVDDVWGLSKDILLETRVVNATFHEGNDPKWTVQTAEGQTYRCKWLVAATGTSFKQYMPTWKGHERFKGVIHHSSLWPDKGAELGGKRVAIIGAGSTGVQVMQEASKVSKSVVQLIRTPNLAMPMRQRQISEEEIYSYRPMMPHVFEACRNTVAGLPMLSSTRKTFDVDDDERNRTWEELWKRGGFNWTIGGFSDTLTSKEANRAAYDFWAAKTRTRIKDPKKRDLLAPLEPPYYIATKRPSMEQDYYEMCDQPHVEITKSPITGFTETEIVTEEKSYEVDVVAICTGYDAVTGGLRTMGIKGRNGIDLDQKWDDGVRTYLGMMTHDFPNFYMMYGPQAPTSLTNGPPFLEMQAEWIVSALCKQRDEKIATVEPTSEAEEEWRSQVLNMADMTLAIHTNSWYMGANVPGKKREYLLYMGGLPTWFKTSVDALQQWKGFELNGGRTAGP